MASGIMDGLVGLQMGLWVVSGLSESQVAMGGAGWPPGVTVDLKGSQMTSGGQR
jgi:hypothetical protein